jgi:branched-chain amino acid aminotransferase
VSHALPAVWVNGERQPGDGRHVSARDRGLTLADGLFETMRGHGGTVFRLERHLARLTGGLRALEIPVPPRLEAWVRAAIDDAAPSDASVRLTVTRGIGPGGLAPPVDVRPTVLVAVGALPQYSPATYERGLGAHIATGRRNERSGTAGLKTLAYTDAVAGFLEARRAGADDALFLDTEGHCSEASSSNLFVWTGGLLVTPPLSCAALPGITRAAVLELAAALGIPAAERPFGTEELAGADEAFLTSSLRGLAPLVRVGGRPIGDGGPGPVTRGIMASYRDLVARECRRP